MALLVRSICLAKYTAPGYRPSYVLYELELAAEETRKAVDDAPGREVTTTTATQTHAHTTHTLVIRVGFLR